VSPSDGQTVLARPRADSPRVHPFVVRPYPTHVAGTDAPAVELSPRTPVTVGPGRARRTLIRPPGRWPPLGFAELWSLRAIAVVLARRSLMVRYRQTLIGAAWVLIQPLTLMLVFTVFFGLFMNRSIGATPYAVFVYLGLLVWMMASRVLSQGSTSVSSNSGLLSKIYFPRAYLPIGVAIGSLVDFAFGFAALFALLVFYAIAPTIGLLTIPLATVIALAAVLGVTFWLSALNAQYRDVGQLLPFLTQVWFFTSPIFYSSDVIPAEWRSLYWLNPIAVSIEAFRWAFAGLAPPPVEAWLIGGAVAVALLVSGYVFFRSREPSFSDIV
jgi:lipopolysaccharide transport system permease protein